MNIVLNGESANFMIKNTIIIPVLVKDGAQTQIATQACLPIVLVVSVSILIFDHFLASLSTKNRYPLYYYDIQIFSGCM